MSQSTNKAGFSSLRGAINPNMIVITSLPTSSYFPDYPKEKLIVIDATSSPHIIYSYWDGIWHS